MHRLLDGQMARDMETVGDGACALHAAFGDATSFAGQIMFESAGLLWRMSRAITSIMLLLGFGPRAEVFVVACFNVVDGVHSAFLHPDGVVPNREEGYLSQLTTGG